MHIEEINLKIKDFNKFIKRKDYHAKKWWAFDVDLLTHPDFFGLDGNDFKVFCWVISVANKHGNPDIRLHIKQASHILQISEENILNSLKKLEGKRWFIESRNGAVTDTIGFVPKNRLDKNRIDEIVPSSTALFQNQFNEEFIKTKEYLINKFGRSLSNRASAIHMHFESLDKIRDFLNEVDDAKTKACKKANEQITEQEMLRYLKVSLLKEAGLL